MDRGAAQPPSESVMHTLFPGEPHGTGANQRQPAPAGECADTAEQRATSRSIGGVVPEDDTRAARQGLDRRPQRVAEPLVGHQPDRRKRPDLLKRTNTAHGLAAGHGAAIAPPMSADDPRSPSDRLAAVRDHIAGAERLARRVPGGTTLIAISKTKPAEAIVPLIAAGQRVFGENRVQEAEAKWPALREGHGDIALHLVGQLQSNKADEAVALFDAILWLDRSSSITALARAMYRRGRRPACFVQVNLADEPQKGGCTVDDLTGLLAEARAADIPVAGLMTVPPLDLEPAPWFALLAKLAHDHGLAGLSMGMSGDYETAVTLGATHVRVGTALFGARA